MTIDQLEALILAIPVPRRSEGWPAYRARCRAIEAEFSASLMQEIDLDALDRLADESRPSGPVHNGSSDWDLHFARVDLIERSLYS